LGLRCHRGAGAQAYEDQTAGFNPAVSVACRRGTPNASPKQNNQAFAAATARLAMTVIRCARYSAEAWISLIRLVAGTLMPSSALGSNLAPSAASIPFARKTPSSPA